MFLSIFSIQNQVTLDFTWTYVQPLLFISLLTAHYHSWWGFNLSDIMHKHARLPALRANVFVQVCLCTKKSNGRKQQRFSMTTSMPKDNKNCSISKLECCPSIRAALCLRPEARDQILGTVMFQCDGKTPWNDGTPGKDGHGNGKSLWKSQASIEHSPLKFNSLPLKSCQALKRRYPLPTHMFQGRHVNFQGNISSFMSYVPLLPPYDSLLECSIKCLQYRTCHLHPVTI